MKKIFLLVIALLVFNLQSSRGQKNTYSKISYNIGDTLEQKYIQTSSFELIRVESSQMDEVQRVIDDSVTINLVIDTSSVITAIYIFDENFITEDNIKIGSTINDVLKTSDDTLHLNCYHSYHIKLKSGWYAGFYNNPRFNTPPNHATNRLNRFGSIFV